MKFSFQLSQNYPVEIIDKILNDEGVKSLANKIFEKKAISDEEPINLQTVNLFFTIY